MPRMLQSPPSQTVAGALLLGAAYPMAVRLAGAGDPGFRSPEVALLEVAMSAIAGALFVLWSAVRQRSRAPLPSPASRRLPSGV